MMQQHWCFRRGIRGFIAEAREHDAHQTGIMPELGACASWRRCLGCSRQPTDLALQRSSYSSQ
jgi:hypothetical protein